jgi:hypothetical protein
MEKLTKKQGILYTQNVEELPIEERVFFSQGLVASKDDYRIATEAEIEAWHEYQAKQEEEQRAMMGGADNE